MILSDMKWWMISGVILGALGILLLAGNAVFRDGVMLGNWGDIADEINSSHYQITQAELDSRCEIYCESAYNIDCSCNWCRCECLTWVDKLYESLYDDLLGKTC